MVKSITDIINSNSDLHFIKIIKPDKHDRLTWQFEINDKTSSLCDTNDYLHNKDYNIVQLRRGSHFFISYKIWLSENRYEYFVDTKKANHRTSIQKYVDNLMNYQVKSNDISIIKNAPSFKLTELEMRNRNIDNFVEMCYQFKEYSAIGIGITRNLRNLIVLDIDVDCDLKENADEINRLLVLFGQHNMLPDFEIHNKATRHVQLQWLIQSFEYKSISMKQRDNLIKILEEDETNKELSHLKFSFLDDYSSNSDEYRLFTRSLTDVSGKYNFGDKNFTFWKAKNFCTALYGLHELELKMPQYQNGEIIYLTKDEMLDIFSTKDKRKNYFDEAPTFREILTNSKPLTERHIEKLKSSICEMKKSEDSLYEEHSPITNRRVNKDDESRNNFVFCFTRNTTWDICREMKFRNFEDISHISNEDDRKLKNKVKKIVKLEFNKKDKEYCGVWPGTSNHTPFSNKEFENTFSTAFDYAKCKFNNSGKYSQEGRDVSIRERGIVKDMKIVVVDYIRRKNPKLKTNELLKVVNRQLELSNQKDISLSTLKRCICASKEMNEDERYELYNNFVRTYEKRRDMLSIKIDKYIELNKKKYDRVSINIIEDIMKSF